MFSVSVLFSLDMVTFQILIYSMTSYFCKNYKSNTCLLQNMKKYIVERKEDPHAEMATVVTVVCIPEVFCKFIIYVTK